MTGYTPQQLLVALGKARRHAWRAKRTVHVVVNDGLLAWATGPLRVVEHVEPHHSVVIRDVHPQPMTSEMCDAYCQAVLHDPDRAGHIADALRGIMNTPAGEPMDTEAVALLLWDLAEHVVQADHKRRRADEMARYTTRRSDLPGYQEPRA